MNPIIPLRGPLLPLAMVPRCGYLLRKIPEDKFRGSLCGCCYLVKGAVAPQGSKKPKGKPYISVKKSKKTNVKLKISMQNKRTPKEKQMKPTEK